MDDQELRDKVIKIVGDYQQGSAYIAKKLTDTPTEDLMVVPRKFVTANGNTRPPNPVSGQFFFDTTLGSHGKPIWWTPDGNWVDSGSNIV